MFLLKTKLDICNDRCSRDLSDLSVRGRTILGSARRAFINRASLTVPCPTHIYHPLSYSCNIPFKAPSIFPRACSDISSWTRVCYSHAESFLDFVWRVMLCCAFCCSLFWAVLLPFGLTSFLSARQKAILSGSQSLVLNSDFASSGIVLLLSSLLHYDCLSMSF